MNRERDRLRRVAFRQVAKEGDLRMHPIVGRLVDKDVLEKMGAKQQGKEGG